VKLLRHLPNAMTCGNLLCGCLGIVRVFEHDLVAAAYLIFLAALLDFGDGFVARLLNAHSAIGKELDSLADMVTFGVLPAFILFSLLTPDAVAIENAMNYQGNGTDFQGIVVKSINPYRYVAFSIAVFSALRLAKFNIDPRQTDSFIGLPTPANALVVASFPLILAFQPQYSLLILIPYSLYAYVALLSFLLVAEIPLFALKFKTFGWAENWVKFVFLGLSGVLLLLLQFAAMPIVVGLYVLVSVIENQFKHREHRD
jgi:CDP-diacylglycerol---serine O-phosphatidyltransferase